MADGKNTIGIDLILRIQKFVDGFKDAESGAIKGATGIANGLKKVDDGIGNATKKVGGLGQALAGGLAGGAIFSVLSSGFSHLVEKASIADNAVDTLGITLTKAGLSGAGLEAELERLSGKAEETADAFAMPKHEVQGLQATISGFGNVTGDELDKLVEISIGTANALQMPAEAVARMVAKGADPEQEAKLGKLGIVFDKNATAAEKMAAVQAKLGSTIQATKDSTQDGFGAMERMKEAAEETAIAFASSAFEMLSPILTIAAKAAQGLSHWLQGLNKWINENKTLAFALGGVIAGVTLMFTGATIASKLHAGALKAQAFWTTAVDTVTKVLNGTMRLNPIGLIVTAVSLLVGGFILLYNNSESVRNAIDSLWKVVKNAGSALLSLLGITDDTTESTGELSTAQGKLKKSHEEAAAAAKNQAEQEKLLLEQFDAQNKSLGELVDGNRARYQHNLEEIKKLRSGAYSGDAATIAASIKQHEEANQRIINQARGAQGTLNRIKDEGTAYDKLTGVEQVKVAKATVETLSASTQATLESNRLKRDSNVKSTGELIVNINTQIQGINELKKATRAAIISQISDAKERNERLKSLDEDEMKAKLALTNALKEEQEKLTDLKNKALEVGQAALQADIQAIDKYHDEYKKIVEKARAEKDAEGKSLISQEEADRFIALSAAKRQGEIAKATKDFHREQYETKLKAAQEESQIDVAIADSYEKRVAALETANKEQLKLLEDSNIDERGKRVERLRIEGEFNASMKSLAEAKINADRELRDLKIENDTEASEAERAQALADSQFKAELADLGAKLKAGAISHELYEQKLTKLKADHAKKRGQIVLDEIEKEIQAQEILKQQVTRLISALTDSLKRALAIRNKNEEKATDASDKLKEFQYKKDLDDLAQSVRDNKISHEEYLLQKAAKEEEFNNSRRESEQTQAAFFEDLWNSTADTFAGMLGKMLENYVQTQIAKVTADGAAASSGLIASIMASIPFPLNLLAIAGGVAVISGAISALVGKISGVQKKAKGGRIYGNSPNDEADDQVVNMTSDEHAVSRPEVRAIGGGDIEKGHRRLEKLRADALSGKYGQTFSKNYSSFMSTKGGSALSVNPILMRSPSSMMQAASMKALEDNQARLEKILLRLDKEGIQIHGSTEIKNEHIRVAYKQADRAMTHRAYSTEQP